MWAVPPPTGWMAEVPTAQAPVVPKMNIAEQERIRIQWLHNRGIDFSVPSPVSPLSSDEQHGAMKKQRVDNPSVWQSGWQGDGPTSSSCWQDDGGKYGGGVPQWQHDGGKYGGDMPQWTSDPIPPWRIKARDECAQSQGRSEWQEHSKPSRDITQEWQDEWQDEWQEHGKHSRDITQSGRMNGEQSELQEMLQGRTVVNAIAELSDMNELDAMEAMIIKDDAANKAAKKEVAASTEMGPSRCEHDQSQGRSEWQDHGEPSSNEWQEHGRSEWQDHGRPEWQDHGRSEWQGYGGQRRDHEEQMKIEHDERSMVAAAATVAPDIGQACGCYVQEAIDMKPEPLPSYGSIDANAWDFIDTGMASHARNRSGSVTPPLAQEVDTCQDRVSFPRGGVMHSAETGTHESAGADAQGSACTDAQGSACTVVKESAGTDVNESTCTVVKDSAATDTVRLPSAKTESMQPTDNDDEFDDVQDPYLRGCLMASVGAYDQAREDIKEDQMAELRAIRQEAAYAKVEQGGGDDGAGGAEQAVTEPRTRGCKISGGRVKQARRVLDLFYSGNWEAFGQYMASEHGQAAKGAIYGKGNNKGKGSRKGR